MDLLEIEQKFTILPSLIQTFRLNKGTPQFTSLKSLGTIHINDAYFEDKKIQILSKNGVWIRRRDGIWEAKRRPTTQPSVNVNVNGGNGGDPVLAVYNRTAFEEIRCHQQIQSLINTYIPNTPDSSRNFDLDISCQFRTKRETYLIDGKFSVMLDETSFGHSTGEVEVEVEIDMAEGKGKKVAIEKAHADIGEFLDKYSWFFRAGKEEPKGKLCAYFEAFPPAWEQ